MANIELPKDADGREIPLDTGTLYGKNGVAKFIYHYDYDPRDKVWYVETDEGSRCASELLLDRDDSWEKCWQTSKGARAESITRSAPTSGEMRTTATNARPSAPSPARRSRSGISNRASAS